MGGNPRRGGFVIYPPLPPLCVLPALETQGISFCYAKDDDSFLAAVSRGWSKHFPKIAGKRERERNPTGGAGTEGRGADQSGTAEKDKTGKCHNRLGPSSGVSAVAFSSFLGHLLRTLTRT